MGYTANYGYTDGSGTYYITIASGKCNGCGDCVSACLEGVFEVAPDDYDDMVGRVRDDVRKDLKYVCAACKGNTRGEEPPCIVACKTQAVKHSW